MFRTIRIGVDDDCPPEEVSRKEAELPLVLGAPVELYIMERSMELVNCHLCDEQIPGLRAVTDNDMLEGIDFGADMHATIFCSVDCKQHHCDIGHDA